MSTNHNAKITHVLKTSFTMDLLDIYNKRIGFTKLQYEIIKHCFIYKDMTYDDLAESFGCDRRTVDRAVKSIKAKFNTAIKCRKYSDDDSIKLLCELCEIDL